MQQVFALVLALCVFAPACRDKAADAPARTSTPSEVFHTRGKIVGLSKKTLDLHHERIAAIRGFDGTIKPMESMTMPFGRNGTSFEGLAVGDIVEISFTAHYDSDPTLRLVTLAKLPADTKLALP